MPSRRKPAARKAPSRSPSKRTTTRKASRASPRKSVKTTRKSTRKSVKTTRRVSPSPKTYVSPPTSSFVPSTVRNEPSVPISKAHVRPQEVMKSPGLRINNTTISSISGPISFYYLRPKKMVYQDGNASYFPLIILFGDWHRNNSNMCAQCFCSAANKTCCYALSDTGLLQLFDSLATPNHPVDFYTETSFEGTGTGFAGGEMEKLTNGMMLSCYHHRLREKGEIPNICPTQHIRWHAADIRNATAAYGNREDIKKSGSMFMDMNKLKANSKKYKENKYIEGQLQFLGMVSGTKLFNESVSYTIFKSADEYKKLLLLCVDGEGEKYTFKRFARALFGMMNADNSVIYKQIKKQTYGNFNQIEVWADFYADSLEREIGSEYSPAQFRKIITEADFNNENDPYKDAYKDIISLNIPLNLLDIYTIARIFKQPIGGKRSSLSFCYFGNAHVQNIHRLLMQTGAYESRFVEMTKEGTQPNRCQRFPFYLDLSEEVRSHNQGIYNNTIINF